MTYRYDPETPPDPAAWLAMSESERNQSVEIYHRDARIALPKAARPVHAMLHAVVETQLAMPDQDTVRTTLARLMREGLTRHDAIHAISTVLIGHIQKVMQTSPDAGSDTSADQAAYLDRLQRMTAAEWLSRHR